ncbi:MAG TPA: N-acetylglucosamine-6-phosphate deacetylase [Gammaproteobacteria bacterium]|jgi:N-acetylglucosamine-6-phosphate deacetylase|nr:N-acetylglucosamine-6-phosphate deacetylase [Gammaproteobacteria bacterium]
MNTPLILSGMQILMGDQLVKDQAVLIQDGLIKAFFPHQMVAHHQPAEVRTYPHEYVLIPGLIDLHVHGVNGKDVMDADPESLLVMSRALAAEGVTGFLATTMTMSHDRIEAALAAVADRAAEVTGAAILGIHLEGPFIAKAKLGAQGNLSCDPDIHLMRRWQKIAKENIKLVTVAPELPSAISFIQALRAMGIVVSVGHTDATYEQTCAAIAAGCSHATHLFNAMRGMHQREPGAAGALLLSDCVTAELIVDGEHLHPAIVDLCLRVKGANRLILVSDAMRAKCLGDGEYELGGQSVRVRDRKATLADGTLAGSVLQLPTAIKNIMAYTGCGLAEAVRMASYQPACLLNMERHKGSIEIGKDADVVMLDEKREVALTLRSGDPIFSK